MEVGQSFTQRWAGVNWHRYRNEAAQEEGRLPERQKNSEKVIGRCRHNLIRHR